MGQARKDWSGQTFDRLTAVAFSRMEGTHAYWTFQCVCGCTVERVIFNVRKNKSNACPDCRTGPGSHAWKGVGQVPQSYFRSVYHGAIARGYDFDITLDYIADLYEQQSGRCALTGRPLRFVGTYVRQTEQTASLDRIDSCEGYLQGNVQWVHRDINHRKNNMSNREFIAMCREVAGHLAEIA